ncbi:hypothetical protein [Mahella australiensis]|uniref:Uncharacterized protein n=1 Tax=Mahella australiensis (strain DSM 15567 / CIP 107919 / 50-1 BON) TaxID=697281 RepID=F3ZX59_MAHA5|nr:hypothetical protein [Mahella australiensis]AEE95508.1 hypothetical protein Mahau_0291 [Mahella australiensis 50-1 BON]
MKAKKEDSAIFRWEISIPILTNRFIMGQMAMLLGIPILIIVVLVFAMSAARGGIQLESLFNVFVLLALLLGMSAILVITIYGNRSHAVFEIGENGIRQYPAKRTAKKNALVNSILFFAGLIFGKPGYAGTALIAHSTNSASIRWEDMRKLRFYPKQKAIAVGNKRRTVLVVYCTSENYCDISQFLSDKLKSMNRDAT